MRHLIAVLVLALLSAPVVDAKKRQASTEQTAPQGQTVIFNTKSGKIHRHGCSAANRCTVNCVETSLADALASGGVNCRICGGAAR